MEELQTIIADLPAWLQLVILAVVGTVVAIFGRRNRANRTQTRSKQHSTLKGTSSVKTKTWSYEDTLSPGQDGPGATRDLTTTEIRALTPVYAPERDGTPDPGEVVWTWVPYVEQDGRGKDRPVLIIARVNSTEVAGCYLSTKEHRGFVHVGTGAWDSQGRPSYLNPERVLLVSDDGMRREGAIMPQAQFDRVINSLQSFYRNA